MADTTGFYTLGSRSGSYVANKRDESGALQYQGAANQIGIEKQRALQDLASNYDQSINNAFATYLAGQQRIASSSMGQGFKEQYLTNLAEENAARVAQANLSAANARQEINTAAQEAQTEVQQAYSQETANLDRALNMMSDYRDYVDSLRNARGESIYDKEQQGWDIKYLYSDLFKLDPKDFYEDEAKTTRGKSYAEWVHDNLTDSNDDLLYNQWLYGAGGLQNLGSMIERSKIETPYEKNEREKTEALGELERANSSVSTIKSHNLPGRSTSTYYTVDGEKGNYVYDTIISIDKIPNNIVAQLQKLKDSGNLNSGQTIKIGNDIYLIKDLSLQKLQKLKRLK